MEPVRNDTTTDRRTAVELAKRLLVDLIWRTAKIEVDGVTFPDTEGDMRMMLLLWDATSLKIVEIPIKTTLNNPDFPEK